ncbi:MAG: nucleotidyltransferase domain-containing protein [Candidatus Aminicenantales bacterium]
MNQFASLDKFLERAWQDRNVLAVLLYGSSARQEKRKGSDNDICHVLRAGQNRRKNGFFLQQALRVSERISLGGAGFPATCPGYSKEGIEGSQGLILLR